MDCDGCGLRFKKEDLSELGLCPDCQEEAEDEAYPDDPETTAYFRECMNRDD